MNVMRHLVLTTFALLITACAGLLRPVQGPAPSPTNASGLPPVELTDTPFFAQDEDQCGPAALAMVLTANGVAVTPEVLRSQVYLPERQGSLQAEIIAATRRHQQVPYVITPTLQGLLTEVAAGHPVVVLQNLGVTWLPVWHYAVLIGYDADRDVVLLRSGTTRRKVMPAEDFIKTWQASGNWGVVALKPAQLPASMDAERYLAAVAGLEATGQLAVADKAYRAALTRWPTAALAWLGRGTVAYRQGRLAVAERAYRRANALAPRDAAVLNNLAQVQAERGCPAQGLATLRRWPADAPISAGLRATLDATAQEIGAMKQRRTKAQCQRNAAR